MNTYMLACGCCSFEHKLILEDHEKEQLEENDFVNCMSCKEEISTATMEEIEID